MQTSIHPIDFQKRRKVFFKNVGNGVAVLQASELSYRNHDVNYPRRQDSSFYYLTGFEEEDSICLIAPQLKHPFQMFVRPKDRTKELWDGYIHGPEVVEKKYGADAAYPSIPGDHFDKAFVEALCEADTVYYSLGENPKFDERILSLMKQARRRLGRTGRPLWPILDPMEILGELRVIKSKPELERMEHAALISAEAHNKAMRAAKPGVGEFEIEGLLTHEFRAHGAERVGYNPIVASGNNACVLHYSANNRRAEKGELLLIDAGAEFDYYSADITRTFPVDGTFSKPQKEIYSAVLAAQKACVEATQPGTTIDALQKCAVEVLVEHLIALKILKGSKKEAIKSLSYREYYPHRIGHYLGMDVHDAGLYYSKSYEKSRKLEPGMVITIEPGLYFQAGCPAPKKYHGIGVRIEDDVVVTKKGCKVLSSSVPKEVEEVEALCQQSI